jgi:hypothetical protein
VNAGAPEGKPVPASLAASDNSINSYLFLVFLSFIPEHNECVVMGKRKRCLQITLYKKSVHYIINRKPTIPLKSPRYDMVNTIM